MKSKKFAIIVAGGSGSRMKSEIPKQFLKLGDQAIIEVTIRKFLDADNDLQVVVVIPKDHEGEWNKLPIASHQQVMMTFGGSTRYQSVTNGLKAIEAKENDVIAIHDAVRPLLSTNLINKCFDVAENQSNAVPSTPVIETLRELSANDSKWVNRANYRSIQTPQTFKYRLLRDAYNQPFEHSFTDDASVVEAMGNRINLVEGERNNIKITTPEDLQLAQLLFTQ